MHWLGVGEDRSYYPKLRPVSNPESKEADEWNKEEEEGSDQMGQGQYPTGQFSQPSHLEMKGEMQIGTWVGRGRTEGALRCWALPLSPPPQGLSPLSPFPCQAGAGGVHGFTGVGPSPWLCDLSQNLLLLASLRSSPPTRLQLWGVGQGAGRGPSSN